MKTSAKIKVLHSIVFGVDRKLPIQSIYKYLGLCLKKTEMVSRRRKGGAEVSLCCCGLCLHGLLHVFRREQW